MDVSKLCEFLGITLNIDGETNMAELVISVNDGFFGVDSANLQFRIVNDVTEVSYEENVEKIQRVCVDDVGCFNIRIEGKIHLPRPLLCNHIWSESNKKEDVVCTRCKRKKEMDIKVRNFLVQELGMSVATFKEDALNQYRFSNLDYEMTSITIYFMARSAMEWIKEYVTRNNVKLMAVGLSMWVLSYPEIFDEIKQKLWFTFDAFPAIFYNRYESIVEQADAFARKCTRLIGFNNLLRLDISTDNRVNVDLGNIDFCSLNDYYHFLGPNYSVIFNEIRQLVDKFKNKKIIYISSTPRGGGVALMRHSHIRFYKLLGLNIQWYVTIPSPSVFKITKQKFHNILQEVNPPNVELTDEDINLYEKWCEVNAERFWKNTIFKTSDLIILDDHQTSGFVKHIREVNKNVKIVYRSHIQIRGENIESNPTLKKTWSYISNNLKDIDYFVSHPKDIFVPADISNEHVIYHPPSTDPIDGLNKPMPQDISEYYEGLFNKTCRESGQTPIDFSKPYIIQICRFDPSKGIKDAIKSFASLLKKLNGRHLDKNDELYGLRLILCGHGSVDDPEGSAVYEDIIEYLKEKNFKDVMGHVTCVKVPPHDQILNAVLSKALVCLQLSYSEGFEVKVTESILKNIPVIVYNTGGLPLQVTDGINGFVVECGDVDKVSDHLVFLLTNKQFSMNMSDYKHRSFIYTTPFQILCWLRIYDIVLSNEPGNGRMIYQEVYDKYLKDD